MEFKSLRVLSELMLLIGAGIQAAARQTDVLLAPAMPDARGDASHAAFC